MCVIALAYQTRLLGPLVLIANRDEAYARASAPLAWWEDAPDILGGRDLVAGGSWLALDKRGRFAAITNVRTGRPHTGMRSRGELVTRFITGTHSAPAFARLLSQERGDYAPFNLLFGEVRDLYHYNSQHDRLSRLTPGIHTLSNATLDTPWPKCRRLAQALTEAVCPPDAGTAFNWLANRDIPAHAELPNTGVGLALEKMLAPVLISGRDYGTRSSTLLVAQPRGDISLSELTRLPGGSAGQTRHFTLRPDPNYRKPVCEENPA